MKYYSGLNYNSFFFAQKYLTQMRARKEVKRGGRCVTVSNPSYYLRPMVHTASSKTCLVSNPKRSHKGKTEHMQESGSGQQSHSAPESDKNRSIGPNLYIALAAAQFKLHNTDRNTKRLKQDQELRLVWLVQTFLTGGRSIYSCSAMFCVGY